MYNVAKALKKSLLFNYEAKQELVSVMVERGDKTI